MGPGIDPKLMKEVDSEVKQETCSTQSVPSSTDEWDRGTTYEYSPKETISVRPPLPGLKTVLILGRILTVSTLPGFIKRWANTLFPYPSLVHRTLTSLIEHMETFNTMLSITSNLLSTHPFFFNNNNRGTPPKKKGPYIIIHTALHNRLTSSLALIQDFQDLIEECEKRIYLLVGIRQGTYVEMQRVSLGSIGCWMGQQVLKELAGRERTRRLEASLANWILDTNKWVEAGMKVVEQEEKRVVGERWILEGDDWFWQDDLYRPMEW